MDDYIEVFYKLVDFIEKLTDKKVYKKPPNLEGFDMDQIDKKMANECMELIEGLKRKDRDDAFVYYSSLISRVRIKYLHEICEIRLNRKE